MLRGIVFLLLMVPVSVFAQERDPTQPPFTVSQPAVEMGSWVQNIKLSQIFYSEQSQSARINGEWVRPGENIDGFRVNSVNPNSVILEKNNERVEITLFKPIKQNEKGNPGAVQ
ncbi:Type II secretory pathway component [Idiomarina sp. M1R2S28]|uniref:Type II secretory pathway component n=1 Tax=Idiomarina rhizosphaerae TaxID=2961572 RepID=A0A9X2FTB9_9GAMM|nr:Type II secretory pathway component [Idiomarina rhizosphaerae]